MLRNEFLASVHTSAVKKDSSLGDKKKKSSKVDCKKRRGKKRQRPEDTAPPPEYNLSKLVSDEPEMKIPMFKPPTADSSLLTVTKLHDVNGLKVNQLKGSKLVRLKKSRYCDPHIRVVSVFVVDFVQKTLQY